MVNHPNRQVVKAKLTVIWGLNDIEPQVIELTGGEAIPTIGGPFFEALIHLPVNGGWVLSARIYGQSAHN